MMLLCKIWHFCDDILPLLHTGDDWPKLQSGLLRLYTMRFCPYSHRVRLVLEYKTIPSVALHIGSAFVLAKFLLLVLQINAGTGVCTVYTLTMMVVVMIKSIIKRMLLWLHNVNNDC